eukprot:GHVL01009168.1.p1 GENE.GHVL01009168.1~~GHVL01009168.1.p1  ORF type:complete len:149 (-),score=4.81 GHVL01009168.1:1225-1671(-)
MSYYYKLYGHRRVPGSRVFPSRRAEFLHPFYQRPVRRCPNVFLQKWIGSRHSVLDHRHRALQLKLLITDNNKIVLNQPLGVKIPRCSVVSPFISVSESFDESPLEMSNGVDKVSVKCFLRPTGGGDTVLLAGVPTLAAAAAAAAQLLP